MEMVEAEEANRVIPIQSHGDDNGKKGELRSMLVKLQTVQEKLLIEGKRQTNMNVESSRVNFSPRLGLICEHSTFTLKRSIDLLNAMAKMGTNYYSVSQFTIQVYIKRQKSALDYQVKTMVFVKQSNWVSVKGLLHVFLYF